MQMALDNFLSKLLEEKRLLCVVPFLRLRGEGVKIIGIIDMNTST